MKMLSSFTVLPSLNKCISSDEKLSTLTAIAFFYISHSIEVNGEQELFCYPLSSKSLLLCSTEERKSKSYIFETT